MLITCFNEKEKKFLPREQNQIYLTYKESGKSDQFCQKRIKTDANPEMFQMWELSNKDIKAATLSIL